MLTLPALLLAASAVAPQQPARSPSLAATAQNPIHWDETHWTDFADGEWDPALYVSRRAELEPDSGCIEFLLSDDVDRNGCYDLVSVDEAGPRLRVHLGTDSGYFPADTLDYAVGSGGCAIIADLNCDRSPELVLAGHQMQNTRIYWGTPSGPSPTNPTTLVKHSGQNEALHIADLDRDGYPDIITGYAYAPSGPLTIFWGSATGYSAANSMDIYVGEDIFANLEVADFDRDGWLDIALVRLTSAAIIYWGPGRTYRIVSLPFESRDPHGLSVADLDADGWLDVVMSGIRAVQHSYVYWGSSTGFTPSRRTILNVAPCLGGNAISDLDGDGRLDIVFFRGFLVWDQPVVYYNTGSPPYFDESHVGRIGPLQIEAAGGTAADLNYDGSSDVVVHAREGCFILWGPDFADYTQLPMNWSHHGSFREPGNVYDRSLTAFYLSSVRDLGAGVQADSGTCSWVARESLDARVAILFRSGDTPRPDTTWTQFAPVPANGAPIPVQCLGGRYLQYQAVLSFLRATPLPELEAVQTTIYAQGVPGVDVGVTQILAPAGTMGWGTSVIPQAVVSNFGPTASRFPVTMRIGAGYLQTVSESLVPGASATVTFPAWTANPVGTLPVVCYTAAAGDTFPANDTAYGQVVVTPPAVLDVGVNGIVAPRGDVDANAVIIPRAEVQNFGTTDTFFPVTMRIGTAYALTVTETLAAQSRDTVSFPRWTANPVGTLPVVCFTSLEGDENPLNDTARATVTVHGPAFHDVGTSAITSPEPFRREGDTVRPHAIIRNYGTETERYFDVRFRIGSAYSQLVTVIAGIPPNGTLDIDFPVWIAQAGSHVVSCSTLLSIDSNPGNDKYEFTLAVGRRFALRVEPDQSDRLQFGERKSFGFFAELQGDNSDIVELVPPVAPAGWSAVLYDSAGRFQLPDNDNDGLPDMGLVAPGRRAWFSLRVEAPASLVGDTTLLDSVVLNIRGFCRTDTAARDSARLSIILVPALSVHNFPNPLQEKTTFVIGLPEDGRLTLTVFNRAGERIKRLAGNVAVAAGIHLIHWDALNDNRFPVAPGTYHYLLEFSRDDRVRRIRKKLVVTRE